MEPHLSVSALILILILLTGLTRVSKVVVLAVGFDDISCGSGIFILSKISVLSMVNLRYRYIYPILSMVY